MQKVRSQQLHFVFADNTERMVDGQTRATGVPAAKEWLSRIAKGKELKEMTDQTILEGMGLLEQVATMRNLAMALRQVVRNKGAAGVDGQSVEEVVKNVRSLLPKLRHELLKGTYQPGDVRRVWIPKPDGGQRGLGIPNVMDRWVQQAVFQILEPIWEPTFHRSSHGFRPNRGAQTAIAQASKYVAEGCETVVDFDLSKFFDRVNHQRLLGRLSQRVKDGRILKLIHQMLKAKVVMPEGTRINVEEGTPQGGPLSPILSNIVLDELDKELERRGLRFVRYADDCNIYVGSKRAGDRVMSSIRRFIEGKLRLKVNEEKSCVTRSDQMHFLGFRLNKGPEGRVEVQLSERSRERMNTKIREFTPRSWGQSLQACMEQLNKYLRGWGAYFRLCTQEEAYYFRKYDAHIRRRLRAIVIRQKKRPRFLLRHLLKCKVPREMAEATAYSQKGIWRRSISHGIHRAYSNGWFRERLVVLEDLLMPKSILVPVLSQQLLLFG